MQKRNKTKTEIERDIKDKDKRQKLLEEEAAHREAQKKLINANKCKRYQDTLRLKLHQNYITYIHHKIKTK